MRSSGEEGIIIRARSNKISLMGIFNFAFGAGMLLWVPDVLDPNWNSSSHRLAWFEDLPPIVRATIILLFGALGIVGSFHSLRLAMTGVVAVFADKGARVFSLTGWHEIAWSEIKRIDVWKGKHPSVTLHRREPSWITRILPMFEAKISLGAVSLPEGALLAELSRRRPDLLAPDIYQRHGLVPLAPRQRAPAEQTGSAGPDSTS